MLIRGPFGGRGVLGGPLGVTRAAGEPDPLAADLYSYHHFNGASGTDQIGNLALTAVNSPGVGAGRLFAATCDVERDSLQRWSSLQDISPQTIGATNSFTLCAWFKPEEIHQIANYVWALGGSPGNGWLFAYIHPDGRFLTRLYGDTGSVGVNSTDTASVDQWNLLTMVHDGASLSITINNGTPVSGSSAAIGDVRVNAGVSGFGSNTAGLTLDGLIEGWTYHVGRAYDASEIANYWASGNGREIAL